MFQIMTADDAIGLIRDGDCVGINAFLSLSNPELLHRAIARRYQDTGKPEGLRLFCSAGFGARDESRFADPYIAAGAVSEIVASHYATMPAAARMIHEGKVEGYSLPLGVLSQLVRAAAAGKDGILSEVGLNLFCDPRVGRCGLNARSTKELVQLTELFGREYLYYKAPRIDVALIKGTTCDPNGNISFEKEYIIVDALALAQATRANGGKVIVQVDRVSHVFQRPRSVIVPGILVDAVVVDEHPGESRYGPALDGDVHVPPTHMDYYVSKLEPSKKRRPSAAPQAAGEGGGGAGAEALEDSAADIIGARAARELLPGDVVNLGIGLPEAVGKHATKLGTLKDVTLTVESGGVGGVPAPGLAFGATIGADMIVSMSEQFDFYDGGGLSVCFMGGLEVDRFGNVNAHDLEGPYVGIGGFANITHATKRIVFCMTFTAKGLVAQRRGDEVRIAREGSLRKFKSEIRAVSFSAKNALQRGQRCIYVTERCVLELTARGLKLLEVYPGVDERRDIRDLLDFDLAN